MKAPRPAAEPAASSPAQEEESPTLESFLPSPAHAARALSEAAAAAAEPERAPTPAVVHGLRSARLVDAHGRRATVILRGEDEPCDVALDADVDAAVVREALEVGDRVMVEPGEDGELVLVGVLRCRQPEKLRLVAPVVEIEADQELVLRSGKSALRLREDGEIEIVGSRISAASRGLFRLVGRMLRLN